MTWRAVKFTNLPIYQIYRMKSKLSRKLVNLCSVCKVWAGKGSFFFPNEQNELPKRRNEADVASQIRLQLRSESFTQEKTEAPCFPTEEITKRSTSVIPIEWLSPGTCVVFGYTCRLLARNCVVFRMVLCFWSSQSKSSESLGKVQSSAEIHSWLLRFPVLLPSLCCKRKSWVVIQAYSSIRIHVLLYTKL